MAAVWWLIDGRYSFQSWVSLGLTGSRWSRWRLWHPLFKYSIYHQCVTRPPTKLMMAKHLEEIDHIYDSWNNCNSVTLGMGGSNKGKHFLHHSRQRIQRIFNYQQGLIQKLAPGVAYQQEFSPDLGWASQRHGTKFGHEMSPKYWLNSRPRGGSEKWSISCHISKQRMSQSSVTAATTDGELVSPEGTQEGKNTCHLAAIRLGPLPTVSPEETQGVKIQDTGPRWLRCISKEWVQWAQTLASSHM